MAPPSPQLTLAQTSTPRRVDLRGKRIEERRAEYGVRMEESSGYHAYWTPRPERPGFHHEFSHRKPHVQGGPRARGIKAGLV